MVQGWQKSLKKRLRQQLSEVFIEIAVIDTEVKVWGGCERVWLCLWGWFLQERLPGDEGKGKHVCDDQDSRGACSQLQPRLKRWKLLAWVGRCLCWLTYANHWANIFGFSLPPSPQAVSCCVGLPGLFIVHSAPSVHSPSSPCCLSLHRPLLTIFPNSHKGPCVRCPYLNKNQLPIASAV